MAPRHSRRTVMVGAAASAVVLTTAPLRADAPKVHDIAIKAFTFDPAQVQVRVGDRIRWTNMDLAPHTATADDFSWDTEALAKGAFAEVVVTDRMETSYFCAFHPHMTGEIEVV